MRGVCLLGATGSIGQSSLDLIRRHPTQFRVVSLSAHADLLGLIDLVLEFQPQRVCLSRADLADDFLRQLRPRLQAAGQLPEPELLLGPEGLKALAKDPAVALVVAGIVGIAGMASICAAAEQGKTILLANKEAVVCAGALLRDLVQQGGASILPIDSEHNAIFQALGSDYRCFTPPKGLRRLLLTASGGPFRTWTADQIHNATPAQALKHPNWVMGQKITIDSASMMNKALEVLEAHWLFGVPGEQIEVVVHPESVIHSMVAYQDGSTLAQLGSPDMRIPIAHALFWPERQDSGAQDLDWTSLKALHFETPDPQRFPALRLARQCLASGTAAATVMNAANEIAVAAFLSDQIRFGQIMTTVEACLDQLGSAPNPTTLEGVEALDAEARRWTLSMLNPAPGALA